MPHIDTPLAAEASALCLAIETLPAGEQATALSIQASELLQHISAAAGAAPSFEPLFAAIASAPDGSVKDAITTAAVALRDRLRVATHLPVFWRILCNLEKADAVRLVAIANPSETLAENLARDLTEARALIAHSSGPATDNQKPETLNQKPGAAVRIHLLNRNWGYGAPEGRLQGYSGRNWGPLSATSRFSVKYGCHFIDLTLAEYEEAREDLAKGATLSGRHWEVVVVVEGKDEGGRMKDEEVSVGAGGIGAEPPKTCQIGGDGAKGSDPVTGREGYPAHTEGALPKANEVVIGVLIDIETASYSELKAFAAQQGFPLPKNVKNAPSARKHIRAEQAASAKKAA